MRKFLAALLIFTATANVSAAWRDWELGGELGAAIGAGSKKGKLLSPGLTVTGTRTYDDRRLQLGLGIMFGTNADAINFSREDLGDDRNTSEYNPGEKIEEKLTVVPFTLNFIYTIYENFYIGGGVGLYNVFYKEVPSGDYRVNIDSSKGGEVKYPSSSALGFQQVVGVEIFPMSPNWNWFVGMKSFVTTSAPQVGSLLGINLGGRVRYSW